MMSPFGKTSGASYRVASRFWNWFYQRMRSPFTVRSPKRALCPCAAA